MPSPAAETVTCPKCRRLMSPVSATPHRVSPGMQRNTYVCYACNETRTYMVPVPAPAPEAQTKPESAVK